MTDESGSDPVKVFADGVEYRRIYHYHVRKTAGTSLNSAFWGLAGLDLQSIAAEPRAERDGMVFVRGIPELIEQGDYFFANSHLPAHELTLPERTYTITVLRDPMSRIVSLYRYLLWIRDNQDNPDATRQEPYLLALVDEARSSAGSFRDFLGRLEPMHLAPQLYMFSAACDVAEAVERTRSVHFVGFTETFAADVARLGRILGLPLAEKSERRFGANVVLTELDKAAAREVLAREIEFVSMVRTGRAGQ